MPRRPLKADVPGRCSHIVNRTAGSIHALPFEEEDRKQLLNIVTDCARLYTVEVVSVVVVGDHYHLVCVAPEKKPDVDEIKRRWWDYYSKNEQYLKIIGEPDWNDPEVVDDWKDRLWRVSKLVRALQMRFTRWFNRRHGRIGPLWVNRFRPVVIETGRTLGECVRYAELNPLRAGVCKRLADYSASTWGVYARTGRHPFAKSAAKHLRPYVQFRLPDLDVAALDDDEVLNRMNALLEEDVASFDTPLETPEEALRSPTFLLSPRKRSRYWARGAIIGSEEFVRTVGAEISDEEYARRKRLTPARLTPTRINSSKRPSSTGIFSWRWLVKDVTDEDEDDA